MNRIYAVVVCYNGSAWIRPCLESLCHSDTALDIVVVDNASTDDSVEVIHQVFPQVELLLLKQNIGFGRANNIGIRMAYDAGATHVFLLNQDARVETGTVSALVNKSSEDRAFAVLSPMHLDGKGLALDRLFAGYIVPESSPQLFSDLCLQKAEDRLYETVFVNAAAWLLTRTCIETVGGFNPAFFLYGEDNNYVHRVRWHGFKLGVYPLAYIYHDRGERPPAEPDMVEAFRRSSLVNYLNPLLSNDRAKERARLTRAALGEALRGNFYYCRILMKERSVLAAMESLIKEKMAVTQLKQPLCFLDDAIPSA